LRERRQEEKLGRQIVERCKREREEKGGGGTRKEKR